NLARDRTDTGMEIHLYRAAYVVPFQQSIVYGCIDHPHIWLVKQLKPALGHMDHARICIELGIGHICLTVQYNHDDVTWPRQHVRHISLEQVSESFLRLLEFRLCVAI